MLSSEKPASGKKEYLTFHNITRKQRPSEKPLKYSTISLHSAKYFENSEKQINWIRIRVRIGSGYSFKLQLTWNYGQNTGRIVMIHKTFNLRPWFWRWKLVIAEISKNIYFYFSYFFRISSALNMREKRFLLNRRFSRTKPESTILSL